VPTATLPGTDVSEPYPNPSTGEPVVFDLALQGTSEVEWSVFTTAYRKIRSERATLRGNRRLSWDLKDSKGKPAASGVYYVRFVVTGPRNMDVIRKVLVMR
jgi:hypothetical protein